MRLLQRHATLLLAAAVTAACVSSRQGPTPIPAPTASSEWPTAYTAAMTEAREARLTVADRTLSDFAQRYPDSPEAAEVPFWRAVYKIDPSNAVAMREATVLLDAYLAGTATGLHRIEATAFRKLISTLDARTTALMAQTAVPAPRAEEKALQEEVVRLRDELAKANAELTRIRRRVARPR